MSQNPPKFLTRLPLIDCSFQLDANAAGDVLVTIPDGYYWARGTRVGCKTTIASASVAVGAGEEAKFAPGDIVTVWDVSLGTAHAADAVVVSTSSGVVEIDTPVTTVNGDLLYHSDDLIGVLEARLKSADVSEFTEYALVTIRTGGNVEISSQNAALDFVLTWGADGEELRDRLRLTGASTTVDFGTPVTTTRPVEGTFYPSKPTVDERIPRTTRRDEHESDYGDVRALSNPQVKRTRVTIRCIGDWRTPGTELHDLEDFLALAAYGYRVRYYPDREEPLAYDVDDNPWGWEDWILKGPLTIDPNRLVPTRTDAWQETLDLALWVDG
jgi:hypothetical protein